MSLGCAWRFLFAGSRFVGTFALLLAFGAAAAAQVPRLGFVPIPPCRVADTHNPNGPFGGPLLTGGATARAFEVSNSSCFPLITSGALPEAYSLNLTVIPEGPLGFITAFPCGSPQPLASNLNSQDGRVKAVAALVPAGTGPSGAVCVFASNDTNLVIDIDGYFLSATDISAPQAFFPLVPCRIADTRLANGPLGGPTISGESARDFPLLSSPCAATIPKTVQAYSLNYTVVPKGPLGFLTTWPSGQAQPTVSTLNAPTGTFTANAAIVPAGTGGDIDVFVSNTSDVVIDINGYFAPQGVGGFSLYTLTPCRVLDTRNGAGAFSGAINVNIVTSNCNASSASRAFLLAATVVPPQPLGFLTLWPGPANTTPPVASTLNASDGTIMSNLAIVPTTSGSISAFASNPTQLVLDIFGFFGPSPEVLLSDDFSGTFPAPNWIIANPPCLSGTFTPVIDLGVGNPAPSLEMGLNGLCSGVQSGVSPFPVTGGLSISTDVALQDQLNRAVIVFGATTAVVSNGISSFFLPNGTQVNTAFVFDTNFHNYLLQVDASGNLTWFRDGVEQAFQTAAFPPNQAPLNLNLLGGGAGAPSTAQPVFFDNVRVTSP